MTIACFSRSKAATTNSRRHVRPSPSHSMIQPAGPWCPRSLLHRRHAANSFSIQLGPPLIRGTRCSVVGLLSALGELSNGAEHHTHHGPSRSMIISIRSRLFGWCVATAQLCSDQWTFRTITDGRSTSRKFEDCPCGDVVSQAKRRWPVHRAF